jgi:hypothetical protein
LKGHFRSLALSTLLLSLYLSEGCHFRSLALSPLLLFLYFSEGSISLFCLLSFALSLAL